MNDYRGAHENDIHDDWRSIRRTLAIRPTTEEEAAELHRLLAEIEKEADRRGIILS